MEAKDTVMEVPAIRELFKERPKIKTVDDLHSMFQQLAKAQAEISFKAGIKEVVEWIEANCSYTAVAGHPILPLDSHGWQAKLKEWGIKQEGG